MNLEFSPTDTTNLARMAFIAEREANKRFRLSRPESVIELLQHVVQSKNEELRTMFDEFLKALSPKVRGDLVYRGVIIDSANPPVEEAPPEGMQYRVSKRVYRGQVIEVKTPVERSAPDAIESEQPRKRSRRIYRGQVIED